MQDTSAPNNISNTGLRFDFFNLKLANFHASREDFTFQGEFGNNDYLSSNIDKKITNIILNDFFENTGPDVDTITKLHNMGDNWRDTFELYHDLQYEISSINNYLFFQHKSFLKTCPVKPGEFSLNDLEALLGDLTHAEYDAIHSTNDEDANSTLEEILLDEQHRWEIYGNVYQVGMTAVSIMIFLEKALKQIFNLLKLEEKQSATSLKKLSTLDAKLYFLKETVGLNFAIEPALAELLFDARIARNRFAHGDVDEITNTLLKHNASDIVGAAHQLICIIFLSIFESEWCKK